MAKTYVYDKNLYLTEKEAVKAYAFNLKRRLKFYENFELFLKGLDGKLFKIELTKEERKEMGLFIRTLFASMNALSKNMDKRKEAKNERVESKFSKVEPLCVAGNYERFMNYENLQQKYFEDILNCKEILDKATKTEFVKALDKDMEDELSGKVVLVDELYDSIKKVIPTAKKMIEDARRRDEIMLAKLQKEFNFVACQDSEREM